MFVSYLPPPPIEAGQNLQEAWPGTALHLTMAVQLPCEAALLLGPFVFRVDVLRVLRIDHGGKGSGKSRAIIYKSKTSSPADTAGTTVVKSGTCVCLVVRAPHPSIR